MSETISLSFPDISGDSSGYKIFLRTKSGTLLNTGGDTITEVSSSGIWTFTLGEDRVPNTNYLARIYSGTAEIAANLVYEDVLYAGHTDIGPVIELQLGSKTVIRGVVGSATTPSTTQFTPSAVSPSGSDANQWLGRILVFDNDTATAALRGQATDITAASAAALPLLTFTALTSAPASGDTFSIV